MNSRQRVRAALDHREPDRVPIDIGGTIVSTMREGAYNRLKRHLGITSPPLEGAGLSRRVNMEEEVLQRMQVDTRAVHTRAPHQSQERITADGRYVNEWGVEYVIPPPGQHAYVPTSAPLANAHLEDLVHYPWPDPLDTGRTEDLREDTKRLRECSSCAIVGNVDKPSILELALAMRGFEQFLVDLVSDPTFAGSLLDRITELQVIRYDKFLEETGDLLDVVCFADDVGIQNGPIMSPRLYRQMIKPRHKLLLDAIRRRTEAKIFFHTCGGCFPLIPDLIEIGVDSLNPVQVSAAGMEPGRLKQEFGRHLSFWGAIDTQFVLPSGTPAEVRIEVGQIIRSLGKDGGFIASPVHNVQDDVPPENLIAMVEGVQRSGYYPLVFDSEPAE